MLSTITRAIKRYRNKVGIAAVHDDHLSAILDQAGLLAPILAGTARCSTCNMPLHLDNIAGWHIRNRRPEPFCDRVTCGSKASAMEVESANE